MEKIDRITVLEEYKTLRDETRDNLRTMSQLYLYMTIITATVIGASINSGNYIATCFLLPLLFPLLLLRNVYLNSNLRINHYIFTHIHPILLELRWSEFVRKSRPPKLSLSSYATFNIIYIVLGLAPNLYFLLTELSLLYYLMMVLNIFLTITLIYNTFFKKQPNYPQIEFNQEDSCVKKNGVK